MDKFEYKASADEIKALIAEGEYAEAVKIADKIDWRRVRSVMMLCTISDLYKINRRYQESKDILLMAYEKHPTGRLIIYSLCELCIKMGEYDEASNRYREFVQIAPRDTGRYVLQYRLYEALDVSIEERIAVLEEFKKREPREKWVYELAYLYHRIGLTTKCVEECDDIFLWFGDGRFVIKALELKMLHQPLSADQQEKYDAFIAGRSAGEDMEDTAPMEEEEEEAEAMPETEDDPEDMQLPEEIGYPQDEEDEEEADNPAVPTTELPEVKPVDVGQYNTINLQMALAESMKEVLAEDEAPGTAEEAALPEEAGFAEEAALPEETGSAEETEETPEETETPSITDTIIAPLLEETADIPNINVLNEEELQQASEEIVRDDTAAFDAQKLIDEMTREAERLQAKALREQAQAVSQSTEYDKFLSQEYDGQISFVVPETERVEKQITGQLSIDDIMAEWEQMKKDNEEKRMEDVRQHILAQTGSLFASFDEATKNGLLEELERAFMAALMKESSRNPQVKKVIFPDSRETEAAARKMEESVSSRRAEEPAVKAVGEPTMKAPVEAEPPEKPAVKAVEEPVMEAPAEEPVQEKKSVGIEPVKEAVQEKPAETEPEAQDTGEEAGKERDLSPEEQELFGKFVHQRKSRRQLVRALDNMSLASCTGNILITGEEEITTLALAKALIREMQYNDSNFSGKVAKVEGHTLNKKDVEATFSKLDNGALIIVEIGKLKPATIASIIKVLEKENMGLLALMVGTKNEIGELLAQNAALANTFNLRVDIEPLDNEALVAYAKQYAEELEYSIDEFGILALHTRIADRQTSDHEVTLAEVRELVDEAIEYANKKTPKHFMDILLAKRYDEEDMIILREKDFMHY
ncbi:MAG: hypothetical protein NC416_06045 [Eubacterium sp.]|nr:hypothetical protein [Eubacterium sp.]